MRLFCFPYAGAGASVFVSWNSFFRELPVELCAVQLPGRETRIKEPPFTELEPLITALLPAIESWLEPPFYFFGHSMGTLVSYQLIRELRRRGLPLPQRSFMSGSPPPNVRTFANVHHESDDAILSALANRYKEMPGGIAEHPGLRELLMPIIRADLRVIERYQFTPEEPFNLPITAIGGEADPSTPRERLAMWSEHSRFPVKIRTVPGGHFYIRPPPRELLTLIASEMGLD